MGKNASIFGKPVPIDAIKNFMGQLAYFRMFEVLPASQNPTEQNGRVHRRNLGLPQSFARADIGPVVVKTPLLRHFFPKKTQSRESAVACLGIRNVPTLFAYAKGREPKSGCGDASQDAGIGAANVTPVLDDACFGIALFPEELKNGVFQLLEKRIVAG